VIVTRDRKLESFLHEYLDGVIAVELEYDPKAQLTGYFSGFRSRSAFQKDVEASLSLQARRKMCPALERDLGGPLDPRRRMLFILGAQKGGTTYLFNALTRHPAFVGAAHAFG
jgi:hypothetical protein